MQDINWKEIEEKLKDTLDEERFRHTLGVSYTAAAIAMAHGYDVQKARLAGMLHDCAKSVPKEKRIPMCEEYGIEVSECEKENTGLLHSKLGVMIADRIYGISDEEILGSIRWHTTGRPEMSILEQIIYIADYIEPNRDTYLEIPAEIRQYAFSDLDRCCAMIMKRIVGYLGSSSKKKDEMTEKACDYYCTLTGI
ncbi:MAG: bis(5'-nucleosyl)-tetraphosphatase (symmetrical) YqeK [Lachnospiraceae bacterium]|nr:bis(5'-nucleosyl)-tetraphosphatase (symmetrical) YqeK [Lachnospiraceae bacterium]